MRRLGDDLAADNQGPVLAEMYDSFMERQTEYHEETRVHYNAEKERIRGELEACSDRVDELIPVGDLYQVGNRWERSIHRLCECTLLPVSPI